MDNVFVIIKRSANNRVSGVFEDFHEAQETVEEMNEKFGNDYFMYPVDFYGKED